MSDERKGMSTLTKVLLIVGGVAGTSVVVLIVVGFFAFRNLMENAPELLEDFGDQLESAAGATLGDVSTSFASVVADAGTLMLFTEGMVMEPAEEGSGFTFNLDAGDESIGFDLVSVSEYLDRVGRGEMYFGDVAREDSGDGAGDAVESAAPEWVSVYPGARHSAGVATEFEEFSFGVEVFLSDASAAEVLEWYDEAAREAGWAVRWTSRISADDGEPRHGSVSIGTADRRVTVLIAEDDRRDSFFVILYKG